jgi:hypothetical protein
VRTTRPSLNQALIGAVELQCGSCLSPRELAGIMGVDVGCARAFLEEGLAEDVPHLKGE